MFNVFTIDSICELNIDQDDFDLIQKKFVKKLQKSKNIFYLSKVERYIK